MRELARQEYGSMRQLGPIKRRRDDMYLVDCCVTSSNDSTAKYPKCLLQRIFEHHAFLAVRNLVGPGGKYEGYKSLCTGVVDAKYAFIAAD